MKIVCEACGAKYSISDDKVRGKVFKIRCKKCSHIIVVKGTGDSGTDVMTSAQSLPALSADDAGTPGPEASTWYVVVDGEQVGPLSIAEVSQRLGRGEINADTFAWRDGLADWQKISAVAELAPLVSSGAPAREEQGPFGAAPTAVYPPGMAENAFASTGEAARRGSDEDVFAAPTTLGKPGGAADLFASAAPTPAAPAPTGRAGGGATVRGGASADSGGYRAESASPSSMFGGVAGGYAANGTAQPSPRHDGFTGQRSENSVLFSLSNLEALASPSAPSAPKPAPGTPTSEGSGLIDIRAMAASTLGTSNRSGAASGGLPVFGAPSPEQDVPAFGVSSFSPVAPMLLPVSSSSSAPKWLWPVFGLLALMIGVLTFVVIKVLPKSEPAGAMLPPATIGPAGTVAAPAAPAPAVAPAAAPAPAVAANTPPAPAEPLPPRDEKTATTAPAAAAGKDHKAGAKDKRHSGGKATGGDSKPAEAAKAVAAAPAPEKKEEAPKAAKGSLDDLLAGALGGPSGGKKTSAAPKVEDDAPAKKPAAAGSGAPLAKDDIVKGMMGVRPKVQDCYQQYKVPGTAMVKVTVAPSGKVSTASVEGKFAGTPTGACVESAVKTAKFPASSGLTFPYPFPLR